MTNAYAATIPPLQLSAVTSEEIISELNVSRYEHWGTAKKRHEKQQKAVKNIFLVHNKKIELPCLIVLTRLCRKFYDEDNNIIGFKWFKDQIADCILKDELKTNNKGTKDSDPRLKWKYKQEKSKIKGCRIEIFKI